MKKLTTQNKNGKNYGVAVYLNLDDEEKDIFENIMNSENRNKSNLASYIIKEYLKEYQAKQSEK